jgi:hypothetical protein
MPEVAADRSTNGLVTLLAKLWNGSELFRRSGGSRVASCQRPTSSIDRQQGALACRRRPAVAGIFVANLTHGLSSPSDTPHHGIAATRRTQRLRCIAMAPRMNNGYDGAPTSVQLT